MRCALLMSAAGPDADGDLRTGLQRWPDCRDGGRVTVVEPGLLLHDPLTATTVTVDGCDVLLADRPAVPLDRALDAYCVVDAADRSVVIDFVAALPAVRLGAVVEIRPTLGSSPNGQVC